MDGARHLLGARTPHSGEEATLEVKVTDKSRAGWTLDRQDPAAGEPREELRQGMITDTLPREKSQGAECSRTLLCVHRTNPHTEPALRVCTFPYTTHCSICVYFLLRVEMSRVIQCCLKKYFLTRIMYLFYK